MTGVALARGSAGEIFRAVRGVARSLRIYYAAPRRRRAMDRLYARFVKPGDLIFDIGSHVGDRIASFRRLGCRVVAVEPQPALLRVLRALYGRDPTVTIEPAALGARPGTVELMLNIDNPTVSTASQDFIAAASGAAGWSRERWTKRLPVPMTTLDALIARHGVPRFVKIDVEGYEADVLDGLSTALPGLSFEFTTIQKEVARRSLARVAALGRYRFNAALGESQSLLHAQWLDRNAVEAWLEALPHEANSGDIYALRADEAAA
jgi:FkbM family methyltransferase